MNKYESLLKKLVEYIEEMAEVIKQLRMSFYFLN